MKIYISGPITGYDMKERREVFNTAAQKLKKAGYEPVNPLELGVPEGSSYEEHMRADIKAMLDCDAIYMLSAWEFSHGAKIENVVAIECGLKVIYE